MGSLRAIIFRRRRPSISRYPTFSFSTWLEMRGGIYRQFCLWNGFCFLKGMATRKWSKKVSEKSDAMDLESSVFKKRSGKQIAVSLKHSAESSNRRKSTPFRSAMSMLNFYINRAGKNLSAARKRVLENAKDELRKLFHRPSGHNGL